MVGAERRYWYKGFDHFKEREVDSKFEKEDSRAWKIQICSRFQDQRAQPGHCSKRNEDCQS